MSPMGSPHPKSLSQAWERDFEDLLPFSQFWEKGLGDEGGSSTCKGDMLPTRRVSPRRVTRDTKCACDECPRVFRPPPKSVR